MEIIANKSTEQSLHEKVRGTMTWYRVPTVTFAALIVIMFMHDEKAFWLGVPFALGGELLQLWAASQLYKLTRLTVSGPYSYVRNPMYTGRFFMGLGFFIMTWEPWLIGIYIVLFAAYAQLRVSREEKRLQVLLAPEYQHYCGEIRRWLPRLKPYSRAKAQRASWAQVRFNSEHLVCLGVLTLLIAIYLRIQLFPTYFWDF